jgi:dihydropteroate synthase
MGVVNVTPDSFSDGGRFLEPAAAIAHARALADEGADMVDLGAESTRPGASSVPPAEQWGRLEPVLAGLCDRADLCTSVDTANARVAAQALAAGAYVINDVTALADPDMADVVGRAGAGVVLMHMRGTPGTMQEDPRYDDVVRDVRTWLSDRVDRARRAGIAEECIAIDPGIGFGKTLAHNLELIARLDELAEIGRPIVLGASRKSFLGRLLDAEVSQRLEGGLVAAATSIFQGGSIIRTHDVAATRAAVRVAAALRGARR